MKGAAKLVLLAVVLTFSEAGDAQEARPIRFWINVNDFTRPVSDTLHQFQVTPNAVIPTPLVGWTCKASEISLKQWPATKADPAHGIQAAPAAMYQSVDLVCASKAGSVSASAVCFLSTADEFSADDVKITDPAGHSAWIGVACKN